MPDLRLRSLKPPGIAAAAKMPAAIPGSMATLERLRGVARSQLVGIVDFSFSVFALIFDYYLATGEGCNRATPLGWEDAPAASPRNDSETLKMRAYFL